MKKGMIAVCLLAIVCIAILSYGPCWAADRFVNHGNGTITDTQTGLMWADKDNGSDINWYGAEGYCGGYSGGGKIGWRMPTQDELTTLFHAGVRAWTGSIKLTGYNVWASGSRTSLYGSFDGADVYFVTGARGWFPASKACYTDNAISSAYTTHRALPVRNAN